MARTRTNETASARPFMFTSRETSGYRLRRRLDESDGGIGGECLKLGQRDTRDDEAAGHRRGQDDAAAAADAVLQRRRRVRADVDERAAPRVDLHARRRGRHGFPLRLAPGAVDLVEEP